MSRQSERLFEALNDVSGRAVDEAAQAMEKKKRRWALRTAGIAAALLLAAGAGLLFLLPWGGGGSGGAGANGSTFMSYAGPVFPLTLRETNSSVSTERDITLDFAPWEPEWVPKDETGAGGWYNYSDNILVTDAYALTNNSGQDQTVSVLYPFASTLYRVGNGSSPTLALDGQKLNTVLYAGNYTGGYAGAWGDTLFMEESPGSVNLDRPDSWEDYRDVLSSGEYLERAFAGYPDLSGVPCIVYQFTDPWGPEESEEVPNPSLRATFRLDYDKTTVLSSGFHAMRYDPDSGVMTQGFSIPQPGERRSDGPYQLIVIGDDIQDMTLQGYVTGGVDDDPTVEAGATVTRYECGLETVLREYAALMFGNRDWENGVDFEMYFGLMKDQLVHYGLLSKEPMQMYTTGWLPDLNFASVDRVFYLEADVTIPAGASVTLKAEMQKEGSYDFYCADTKNRGIYGYDLVMQLGSNLDYTRQTATLEDRGLIEIVRDNFGFDLENNILSVVLDPAVEHYFLEVRRLDSP